jgi:hypothetical protein
MFGSFILAMFFSVKSSFQLVTVLSSGLVASILLQCLRAYGVHIFDGSNGFIMDLSIQVHFKGAFADSCCIDKVSLCLLYFYGIMLCRSVTLSQHLNTSLSLHWAPAAMLFLGQGPHSGTEKTGPQTTKPHDDEEW